MKYGGLKFLEAGHVKDVLSLLRWADNPRNRVAGFRALRLTPGVGPATATKVLDAARDAPDLLAALAALTLPHATATEWDAFVALVHALRTRPAEPAEVDVALRWYEPQLNRLYEDAAVRIADLAQLRGIASTFATRERFLTEMALDPPDATSDRPTVRDILGHLDEPAVPPRCAPARGPPLWEAADAEPPGAGQPMVAGARRSPPRRRPARARWGGAGEAERRD